MIILLIIICICNSVLARCGKRVFHSKTLTRPGVCALPLRDERGLRKAALAYSMLRPAPLGKDFRAAAQTAG
ncbi:hypothetical protein AGJ32_04700 [Cronobacter turicensis]|nr:hypothetical protein [Cronobacter turicensis]EGT5739436.1 hypothetical protein [Cronobacter turicensis]NCH62603.1 hypothetical protein [Cronobacter turicensis]